MITAVVMVGDGGDISQPAGLVTHACRAATQDLLHQLANHTPIDRIFLLTPTIDGLTLPAGCHHIPTPAGSIHFGDTITPIIHDWQIDRLLYFGGGSAPLLDGTTLTRLTTTLNNSNNTIITNNIYSTDWAGITPANCLLNHTKRLPRDNMLGWVLTNEDNLQGITEPAGSITRLDIDTPTDLITLSHHPHTKPHLRHFLQQHPLNTTTFQAIHHHLATPGQRIFITGRLSPHVWHNLNQVSQCWLRVLSEERGMVGSGRAMRGEVFSLLANHIDSIGLEAFFTHLPTWADAALIDSRVLFAHYQFQFTANQRFASDLGLLNQINHDWLYQFTHLAHNAPIPILLGGHSLLTGNLYAICDLLTNNR